MYKKPSMQRGVALITVLLIVAISTTIATALSFQQRVDIRRTMNIMHWEQAYLYALSAEDLAKLILQEDKKAEEDPNSPRRWDSLDEEWAKKRDPFPTLNGYISGTIEDLQGRFNLNSLIDPSKNNKGSFGVDASNKNAVDQFINLLELVIEEDQRTTLPPLQDLANAVVDWIDQNNEALPGGAEELYYQSLEKPYRPANNYIASTSELLLIKDFTLAIYRKLEPHIVALPVATLINVNTASAQVLASLHGTFTAEMSKKWTRHPDKKDKNEFPITDVEGKGDEKSPFETPTDFLDEAGITDPAIRSTITNLITVQSNFFQLNAITMFGESQARVKSVFYRRDKDTITVIMRGQGVL